MDRIVKEAAASCTDLSDFLNLGYLVNPVYFSWQLFRGEV
jgi:hypothetical protein